MLAVSRHQHWPLTAWLVMIILRFLHRLCLAGTWRREEKRGGAVVLPFGQVFTLNRSPGGKQPEGLITSPGITDQFASGTGSPRLVTIATRCTGPVRGPALLTGAGLRPPESIRQTTQPAPLIYRPSHSCTLCRCRPGPLLPRLP